MKGRILQRAELFLQKEGEEKARHIKRWEDCVRICHDLGIKPDCHNWVYKAKAGFPSIGTDIKKWPEEEPEPRVGPIRLMLNVGPGDDFQKVKDLGITDIFHYSIYWEGDDGRSYLDKAEKHGLGVAYSLEGPIRDQILQGRPWEREGVDRAVRLCDEHPAASIIEVTDEPDMAYYDPKRLIDKKTQREICGFIRERTNKPLMVFLSGGVSPGWDLVDLSLWDIIGIDHYCWDGTGHCYGDPPLKYFEDCCAKATEYLENNCPDQLGKVLYIFQCCDSPAVGHDPPIYNSKVPLGEIENQFKAAQKYNLFTAGLGFWGWNGGFFGPCTSKEMYKEVRSLLAKVREDIHG